jgi:hypothetical protein
MRGRDTRRTLIKHKHGYMKAKLEETIKTNIFGKCVKVLMNSRRVINLALML